MIVTFISQCDKKAINRTRRVLDAFANRIGDNTWQTVITEDGLLAVKQLLRKTVTKNTAVSCHWIRSRSRSELVWIVGNRNKFNKDGFVPVNFTSKEVFMDVSTGKPVAGFTYANTHLQSLSEHLFAVGYIAELLCRELLDDGNKKAIAAFVAGCLHDLGKIDPQFQEWLRKKNGQFIDVEDGQHIDEKINGKDFSFDKHPRHNEISAMLYQLLDNKELKGIPNPELKQSVKHVVFWHHAKPFRKGKDIETYGDVYSKLSDNLKAEQIDILFEKASKQLDQVCSIDATYRQIDTSKLVACFAATIDKDEISTLSDIKLPRYKTYEITENIDKYKSYVATNADNNIIRSCVITADRLISALSADELHAHIKNKTLGQLVDKVLFKESILVSHIEQYLTSFSAGARSTKQSEVAHELLELSNVAVLAGAAGCGKTKIALEWAKLKNAQQIIWVCPRVQVCEGIFEELSNIDNSQSLATANIEIMTGEFKFQKQNGIKKITPEKQEFQGDIVITTIDQILNSIISHTKIHALIDFLNVHVVFDEFHEYVNMPAFNLLFAELIACKKLRGSLANTLLVSATPHYYYIEEFLGLDSRTIADGGDVAVMPSFNQSLYQIQLEEYDEKALNTTNPLYTPQLQKTFVISNTAKTAQLSFMHNREENNILFHARFKRTDKQQLFQKVFNSFKKDGDNQYLVLRSGPIVQASLNISCDFMISEMTSAENVLQRLGRLNRFGENSEQTYTLKLLLTDGIQRGKGVGNAAYFLKKNCELQSASAWYDWLATHLEDHPLTLKQIYQLYEDFYKNSKSKSRISADFLTALSESVKKINQKLLDPIVIMKPKEKDISVVKVSKNSLRGNTVFVQMAVCDVTHYPTIKMLNEYAYTRAADERTPPDFITEELSHLENNGLIDYAAQKHGRIDKTHPASDIPAKNMVSRKAVIRSAARSSDYPIYTSYTQNHLDAIGEALNENGLVYAMTEKQAIGSIAYSLLKNPSSSTTDDE